MSKIINSKKGFFLQLPTDIQGWFIFFIGILFWTAIFLVIKTEVTYDIKEQASSFSKEDVLLTFLESPVNYSSVGLGIDKNLADMINDFYFDKSNDNIKEVLKEEINEMLNSAYGIAKPVCWKLWYYEPVGSENENVIVSVECDGEKEDILDARAVIPLKNKVPIEIRLIVPGYKE